MPSNRTAEACAKRLSGCDTGRLLVVFPAGEVASFDAGKRIVTDPPWNTGIVRMATRVKAPVVPVFFDGSNGLGFQVAGMVHPRLRTDAVDPRVPEQVGQNAGAASWKSGQPEETGELCQR